MTERISLRSLNQCYTSILLVYPGYLSMPGQRKRLSSKFKVILCAWAICITIIMCAIIFVLRNVWFGGDVRRYSKEYLETAHNQTSFIINIGPVMLTKSSISVPPKPRDADL